MGPMAWVWKNPSLEVVNMVWAVLLLNMTSLYSTTRIWGGALLQDLTMAANLQSFSSDTVAPVHSVSPPVIMEDMSLFYYRQLAASLQVSQLVPINAWIAPCSMKTGGFSKQGSWSSWYYMESGRKWDQISVHASTWSWHCLLDRVKHFQCLHGASTGKPLKSLAFRGEVHGMNSHTDSELCCANKGVVKKKKKKEVPSLMKLGELVCLTMLMTEMSQPLCSIITCTNARTDPGSVCQAGSLHAAGSIPVYVVSATTFWT